MRITVDRDRCIGAGQCVLVAPDVFTQDDEAIGAVLEGREDGADDPGVRDATAACPVQAVIIVE